VHAWLRWRSRSGVRYYLAALLFYVLALLSKESAVALVPILALVAIVDGARLRSTIAGLAPFAVLAGIYALLIFAAQDIHGHLHDAGTFSWAAPFWITWPRSMMRIFWPWGLLGVLALAVRRRPIPYRILALGGGWAGVALIPYCFLTYMTVTPSRHTYFAAVGVALIFGAGFWSLQNRFAARPWVAWLAASVFLAHQCSVLWFKKQRVFEERAAPTEKLVAMAAAVDGPVWVHCFPVNFEAAQRAVELRLHKPAYPMLSGRALEEIQDRSRVYCDRPHEHEHLRTGPPNGIDSPMIFSAAPARPPAESEPARGR
jgi:hypothetical protein